MHAYIKPFKTFVVDSRKKKDIIYIYIYIYIYIKGFKGFYICMHVYIYIINELCDNTVVRTETRINVSICEPLKSLKDTAKTRTTLC